MFVCVCARVCVHVRAFACCHELNRIHYERWKLNLELFSVRTFADVVVVVDS